MVVNKVPETSQMVITIKTGLDSKGKAVLRKRSYKNVKIDAADADVYTVAQALANLQIHEVDHISRQDDGKLVNPE